jgi:hypothetical protein
LSDVGQHRTWEATILIVAAAVLASSLLITPSAGDLTLFGFEIPVMCTWRRIFGVECPGCGLTRSFTYMAHGLVAESWSMNKLGPPLFGLIAIQVPYRLIRIVRGPRSPTRRTGVAV